MYISSNDKVVRAKKGTGGLHLVKTVTKSLIAFVSRQNSDKTPHCNHILPHRHPPCRRHHPQHSCHHPHDCHPHPHPHHLTHHLADQVQAIIIAQYAEPVTAEQCAVVTEKLGDYLVSVGY